jgi:hypothetical protein
MKKIIIGVLLVSLTGSTPPVCAQYGYTSGAYGELDKGRTYFQRLSDWVATVGKTSEEKAIIRARRRNERKIKNAQKAIARKKKEIAKRKAERRNSQKQKEKRSHRKR